MGSTLEAAITFSLVIVILTMFVVLPADIWEQSLQYAKEARAEIDFHIHNESPVSSKEIGSHQSVDCSGEQINTMVTGIIDSLRIMRG